MDLKSRVEALEKKAGVNGNIEEAKDFVSALLRLKIITPEQYESKLEEVIKEGGDCSFKPVLDYLAGRSLGLPKDRKKEM